MADPSIAKAIRDLEWRRQNAIEARDAAMFQIREFDERIAALKADRKITAESKNG